MWMEAFALAWVMAKISEILRRGMVVAVNHNAGLAVHDSVWQGLRVSRTRMWDAGVCSGGRETGGVGQDRQ